MQVTRFRQGSVPLLVSVPHTGTHVPEDLRARMTEEALRLPDTDWHVDKLYAFAEDMGASLLVATHSRYVIDLNRPSTDESLYPGQVKTGLCPAETFAGEKIYKDGSEVGTEEKSARIEKYWRPYHNALSAELQRLKEVFGYALLYDAHSIKSVVPRLFEGRLPDLNLGSSRGQACAAEMAKAALQAASSGPYHAVLDGRFVGGYITRHYGQPDQNVHALQMELAEINYMDEEYPFAYDGAKAQKLQAVLQNVLQAILDSRA